MPIFEYRCEKCNFKVEESLPINERDNIKKIISKYCPERKETMITDGKVIMIDVDVKNCELKRIPTKSNFKI